MEKPTLPLRADVLLSNTLFGELDDGISQEFLQRYTGNVNLEEIDTLELQVDTVNGAQQVECMGPLLPNLVQLRLNHSNVGMLRDLGTGLSRLRVLWLCRSALQDLGGIAAMPVLEELYVSFNDIHDLSPLLTHEALQVLDLEGNLIDDFGEVRSLQAVASLRDLTLGTNPVCRQIDFSRDRVLASLPQLEVLDDVPRGASVLGTELEDDGGDIIFSDLAGLLEVQPLTIDDLPCAELDNRALRELRQRAGQPPVHQDGEGAPPKRRGKASKDSLRRRGESKDEGAPQPRSTTKEAWLTGEGAMAEAGTCAAASADPPAAARGPAAVAGAASCHVGAAAGDASSKAVAELQAGRMEIRATTSHGRRGGSEWKGSSETEPSEQDLVVERLKRAPRPMPSLWSFRPSTRMGMGAECLGDRPQSSYGSLSTCYRPSSASSGTTSGKSASWSASAEESSSSDLTTGDDGAALAGNPLAVVRRRRRHASGNAGEELGIRSLLQQCESSAQALGVTSTSAQAKFQAEDDVVQARLQAFTRQGEAPGPGKAGEVPRPCTPDVRIRLLTSSKSTGILRQCEPGHPCAPVASQSRVLAASKSTPNVAPRSPGHLASAAPAAKPKRGAHKSGSRSGVPAPSFHTGSGEVLIID